jgi:hypothetical protein
MPAAVAYSELSLPPASSALCFIRRLEHDYCSRLVPLRIQAETGAVHPFFIPIFFKINQRGESALSVPE